MKKFLLLFSCLIGGTVAQAQDMYIGPKIGLNVSNPWNSKGTVSTGELGPHLGGIVNYGVNNKYAVQGEVVYSSKAYVIIENQAKVELNYLDVPLLFTYNFVPGLHTKYYLRKERGHFFVMAGPQLSILLNGKASIEKKEVADLKAYARPFDVSAVAGVGYKFHNGLNLSMNYALGLRTISGTPNEFVPVTVKNGVAQASISYLLPLTFPKRKMEENQKTKLKVQKELWY